MSTTGMARRVDGLGRVVIPKEIRDNLSINSGDALEITVSEGKICLVKVEDSCIFCGTESDIVLVKERNVCQTCLNDLKN